MDKERTKKLLHQIRRKCRHYAELRDHSHTLSVYPTSELEQLGIERPLEVLEELRADGAIRFPFRDSKAFFAMTKR